MPCIADWSIDASREFYISAKVSKVCEPKELDENTVQEVQSNDVVFVKTDFLKNNYFQSIILPKIKNDFILISGISSYTVDNYHTIIDNPHVKKWYCTNPPIRHEKVVGLPIGFEEKERDGGNQQVLLSFYGNTFSKIDKILLPYHTASTNSSRKNSIEYLKTLPFVDVQQEKLNFKDYLELLSQYKYCICLEGAGYDTHRNYECLLVGTVPIMSNSNIRYIYDDWDLPSVFVDDWKQVDHSLFNSLYSSDFDFASTEKFLFTKSHMGIR